MLVALEAAPSPSGRRLLRSGSSTPSSENWAKRSLARSNLHVAKSVSMRERHFSEWATACLRPALACAHAGQLSVWPNCSKSVRRNGARRTCRNSGTNRGRGIAACGCNTGAMIPTLPPSSSSAFGVNSLPCASSNKLPFHRSLGGIRLIVQEFATPLEVPTRTVFDMSIGPNYFPCSRCEYTWPRRRLDGCRGIHHIRSPSCAKEELARKLSSHLDQPKTDGARWWHTAQRTSTDYERVNSRSQRNCHLDPPDMPFDHVHRT